MTRLTAKSLTRDIDQFLVFKHALGYPYLRGEATLRSFQRFATRNLERNGTLDLAAAINLWLARLPFRKPVTRGFELGPVRQLCHFRRRRDPKGGSQPQQRSWSARRARQSRNPNLKICSKQAAPP